MEILIYIGERLREERERLGLSQSDFAEIAQKMGVSGATRQSQSNYEKGKQTPAVTYLAAIASSGADVQYILTGIRATPQAQPTISPREAALLDNYQHTDDYGKCIIEATAFAAAESKQVKKRA
jgi:transcriptional regulator with XRE-family HTH domain